MAGKTVEKRTGTDVDTRDEPSVEWGWHGTFPKAARAGGWFTAFVLFMMLIGNHEGQTENIWLVGLGSALVLGLLYDMARRRTAWRR
ncbi:hypothetical protein FHU38_003912 [Saccharomonospora amisosensis]|uniref:DUF2631 domain-containing protein n=1 Tax=Saccharomonospora amisosensis TaxID=1128677 RepID=A0A7X5ZS57_9PSEU|nr:DUF2631 domain-containing protein [Saccharomonospora amisosensis]NIJ13568.1 hypothetical protein [Saccharomonospora amisosensis]